MAELIFQSEKPDECFHIVKHSNGKLIISDRYVMSPEEAADLTEALLRSLDPVTRASVISAASKRPRASCDPAGRG